MMRIVALLMQTNTMKLLQIFKNKLKGENKFQKAGKLDHLALSLDW